MTVNITIPNIVVNVFFPRGKRKQLEWIDLSEELKREIEEKRRDLRERFMGKAGQPGAPKGNGNGATSGSDSATTDSGASASLADKQAAELIAGLDAGSRERTGEPDAAGSCGAAAQKKKPDYSFPKNRRKTGNPKGNQLRPPKKYTDEQLRKAIEKAKNLTGRLGACYIGGILEAWMYAKTKSRMDVATSSGYQSSDISTFINDKRRATPDSLARLAKVFRVDVPTFLQGPPTDQPNDHKAVETSGALPPDYDRYRLGPAGQRTAV